MLSFDDMKLGGPDYDHVIIMENYRVYKWWRLMMGFAKHLKFDDAIIYKQPLNKFNPTHCQYECSYPFNPQSQFTGHSAEWT